MEYGITRIAITDTINGSGSWRFREAKARQPFANGLYRTIFDRLGMPLLPGELQLQVTKDEFAAGYDRFLGIDVILTFANRQESTMQEKFLLTKYRTVTVEHMQNPLTGEQGDWFNMKCDYYFVGYDRTKSNTLQEWILLSWPITKQMTNQGKVQWSSNKNAADGARADFKFVDFGKIPNQCIVLGMWDGKEHAGDSVRSPELFERKHDERRAEQMLLVDVESPIIGKYGDYRNFGQRR